MFGDKIKPLLFFIKLQEALFALCIYFLLIAHSFIEFFEQSRFGRDTISLYKKVLSKTSTFNLPFKK